MILRGHYQNGYITHTLDGALEILADRFGLTSLSRYDASVTVDTPEGQQPLSLRIAAGWAGGINIEIIEAVSGYVMPLVSMLPQDRSDPTPRLHHIALRRDDLDAMRREIDQSAMPLAFGGESAGMVFAYLDARSSLGHYVELVWKAPGGWEKIGWPRGRPVC
jgi:hypothetical protein